jgi:adenylylsulfate kinase-like enzyme
MANQESGNIKVAVENRKILIMGLPGAGKSTCANALAPLLNAVTFNADAVRTNLSPDLGFIQVASVVESRCSRPANIRGQREPGPAT